LRQVGHKIFVVDEDAIAQTTSRLSCVGDVIENRKWNEAGRESNPRVAKQDRPAPVAVRRLHELRHLRGCEGRPFPRLHRQAFRSSKWRFDEFGEIALELLIYVWGTRKENCGMFDYGQIGQVADALPEFRKGPNANKWWELAKAHLLFTENNGKTTGFHQKTLYYFGWERLGPFASVLI
jgi:hypothetical protein